uniref:Zinc phosphodiesterase ELAC protein 2 n=1 Tax=Eptatretus burgeri TaxID=7764 RepID=A0A8C4QNP6_EPTBU
MVLPVRLAVSGAWSALRAVTVRGLMLPAGARKQRDPKGIPRHVKIRQKATPIGGPTFVHLEVLAAGGRDAGAAVHVASEFGRYLFNCGEGIQRLVQEFKVKAVRMENIFITRMDWSNIGGLPGMILTLNDTGLPSCRLFGPPELNSFLDGMKTFSSPLTIKIDVQSYKEPMYVDSTMSVQQIPIFSEKADSENPTVVSYLCKVREKPGGFLREKGAALGLPMNSPELGTMVRQWKEGKAVHFDGREIQPEEVLMPPHPSLCMLILECPDDSFVEPLCSNEDVCRCQTDGKEIPVALVVHMTPETVLANPTYQDWMRRFGEGTEHLIVNEQANCVHFPTQFEVQAQLNLIHPGIFPQLPAHTPLPVGNVDLPFPHTRAECMLKYELRPQRQWHRDSVPEEDKERAIQEAWDLPDFADCVKECHEALSLDVNGKADTSSAMYPHTVFLGTGSALPCKSRNVSAILFRISEDRSVLLDCGEGTTTQLWRHYGHATDDVLLTIKAIFISHMHADHHLGLFQISSTIQKAMKAKGMPFTPLTLVAPQLMLKWLTHYDTHCHKILHHFHCIPNWKLQGHIEHQHASQLLLESLGLSKFMTCTVYHCKQAYGCVLEHASGWKVVYSGDTMPCDRLVKCGENATLLIHEATFEDGLEDEARARLHSTTTQAVAVGRNMAAGFTLLTHFSQRYARVPLFGPEFGKNIGIAFDHMHVGLNDLPALPRLIPPLKILFAEHLVHLEERRDKREMQQHQQMRALRMTLEDVESRTTHSNLRILTTSDDKAPEEEILHINVYEWCLRNPKN